MRRLLVTTLLAFAAAAGCAKQPAPEPRNQPAAQAEVAEISVEQLDQQLARRASVPVDANGKPTRQQMGIIPGAILLTDFETIDNLPADRSTALVFYCANTSCGASHQAAAKAITAGYTNVKVLPEGIAGWVKAGKQTTSI